MPASEGDGRRRGFGRRRERHRRERRGRSGRTGRSGRMGRSGRRGRRWRRYCGRRRGGIGPAGPRLRRRNRERRERGHRRQDDGRRRDRNDLEADLDDRRFPREHGSHGLEPDPRERDRRAARSYPSQEREDRCSCSSQPRAVRYSHHQEDRLGPLPLERSGRTTDARMMGSREGAPHRPQLHGPFADRASSSGSPPADDWTWKRFASLVSVAGGNESALAVSVVSRANSSSRRPASCGLLRHHRIVLNPPDSTTVCATPSARSGSRRRRSSGDAVLQVDDAVAEAALVEQFERDTDVVGERRVATADHDRR